MPKLSDSFDPQSVEWRRISDPREQEFKVDFEYSLLGYDLPSGRLDMLLRFEGNGGHCRRHRHIASTVTLILEGEQHVTEMRPDGATEMVIRKQGAYALAGIDALPHLERGGPDGCTLLLSLQAPDGKLFEYFDQNLKSSRILTIEQYVESWDEELVHGATKAA